MAKIERRSSSGVHSSLFPSLMLLLVCAQKAAPSYLNAGEREHRGVETTLCLHGMVVKMLGDIAINRHAKYIK